MKRSSFLLSTTLAIVALMLISSQTRALTATPGAEKRETIKAANDAFRAERSDAVADLKMKKASGAGEFKDTMQDARKERVASVSAARQQYRSERASVHGERIERRFAFYAERLNNIATRIQTRIDKNKAEGKDVSTAQTTLDTAKATLTLAINDGKQAVTMFQSISVTSWDVQAPQVKAAIDQAMKARLGFANARKAMLDAVSKL